LDISILSLHIQSCSTSVLEAQCEKGFGKAASSLSWQGTAWDSSSLPCSMISVFPPKDRPLVPAVYRRTLLHTELSEYRCSMNHLTESQGRCGVGVWFIMFIASASSEDTPWPPAAPGYNHVGTELIPLQK
jgi:hypothetical protein